MTEFVIQHGWLLLGIGYLLLHLVGLGMALHVILNGRTPQGTVAWLMALLAMPTLAIPLYLFLGSPRFWGYIRARRAGDTRLTPVVEELVANARGMDLLPEQTRQFMRVSSELARMPFSKGNDARLLINGEATFDAICAAIDEARDYILVQFYIFHDDGLGRRFRDHLIARARAGVRVHLLYDEIGCWDLPRAYLDSLREAGVEVAGFSATRRWQNRFRINFRNHRKVVVVDGRVAFLGGHNVGDEYLGLDPKLGHWRDTHVRLEGPVVHAVQLAFLEDWYWSREQIPELDWQPRLAATPGLDTLILPSGPADELDTFEMFVLEAINAAQRRLWIVSPYFVPDEGVIHALQLAAMRGVDVRIMLPAKADHLLVHMASYSYLGDLAATGARVYRYGRGFLHQKVLLVDEDIATVGTANFDNRSFRINFEITAVFVDAGFAAEVEQMLRRDFRHCIEAHPSDFEARPFWFRIGARLARLFAPML